MRRFARTIALLMVAGTVCCSDPPAPSLPPGTRVGYYAAPNGTSSGDGSTGQPWDLALALRGGDGRVQPGDTIWLRGGSYGGVFTSTLTGTASAPIIVRGYPGERATLDGDGSSNTLKIDGAWTYYWGFEIQNSTTDRTNPRTDGVWVRNAANVKLIHLLVHDGGSGIYTSRDAPNVEIYGCIVYNNGWQLDAGDRGHGHAIYVKNDAGTKTVRDNVLFNQYGFGVHEYSNAGSGGLNGIWVEGNVAFNNGALALPGTSGAANLLVGGEEPVNDGVVLGNMTYYSSTIDQPNLRIGSGTLQNGNVLVNGNYAVGGDPVVLMGYWTSVGMAGDTLVGAGDVVSLSDPTTSGFSWSGNHYYRDPAATAWRYEGTGYSFSGWQTATGLSQTDQAAAGVPTGVRVAVRPSVYESGRALIVVYNWGLQGTVAVNVSGVLASGDRYEVRSVQALFGAPVTSGTYAGGTIAIPMTGITPPTPIGLASSPAPVTGPAFDAFVLTRQAP